MSESETTAARPRPRANRAALRQLREPIPAHNISKKPRVYCWACNRASEAQAGAVCHEHASRWCDTCRSYVSNAHEHDEYVGHAEFTDKFLEADLLWNWRPMALDERGLPALDDDGGMWIYLTIGGVERLGYGHANGKTGGAAISEVISNALKSAGIRFGTALNQRAQTDLHAREADAGQPDAAVWDAGEPPVEPQYADPNWVARVGSMLGRKRGAHGEDRPAVLSEILKREVTDVAKISPDEARRVVRILSGGPDLHPPTPPAAEPPDAEPEPAPAPPTESAPTAAPPQPSPRRAEPDRRATKPVAPGPGKTPAAPGPGEAHVRTINSLLSSRGIAAGDTQARMRAISSALDRTVESMDDLTRADAEALYRKLGSGDAAAADPPPAAAATDDTEPDRSTFNDLATQITQAATDEDATLIKVGIGKALTANLITKADGAILSDRLDKRGRQVGTP